MKRLINFLDKNLLLKIASLNSLAVITRVLVGFITSKAIAYFIGPSGMALVGNLRDFTSAARSFGSLGFYNGIVKYVAEFKEDTLKLAKTVSTVCYTVLFASILVSLFCYFSANYLNDLIFGVEFNYSFVFKVLAYLLPFYSINLIILAILNGTSRFKFLIYVSIIGQIVAGCLTIILIWKYSVDGALIAIVCAEITVLFILLVGIRHRFSSIKNVRLSYFKVNVFRNLSAYSIMALFSATILPIAYVYIRNYIKDSVGIDEAGYWEAMNRISKYYLMFISTLLTLYVLPRFSEIKTSYAFRYEVFNFYKKIVPVFALGLIVIYFLREYIILIVLTDQFIEVQALFIWQLLGDLLKVLSLVISFQFLAKKMLWPYLITELISITILLTSSFILIDIYGEIGATMAHFITYLIYLIMMLLVFRKELFLDKDFKI